MKKITSVAELKESILELEIRCASEKIALKEQFHTVRESLRPATLIKDSVKSAIASPDLKEKLITAAVAMATGYLTKKAVFGSTINPLKKLAGAILQMGVTHSVSKNGESIKSLGKNLWNRIVNHRSLKKEILNKVNQL